MIARLKTLAAAAVLAAALGIGGGAGNAVAATGSAEIPSRDWSFDGVFGAFDRAALQRGFQVYQEVCASCHALSYVAYRHLDALGYNEAEIKAIAAAAEVEDGPNDEGEMFMRPGKPSDRFVSPFPNEQAARAANGGAYPPDLALIVKARANGANYAHALLVGYVDAPADVKIPDGMYYNASFPGHQIAMPQPLNADGVEYGDGTPASIAQQAEDVVTFLAWASEPEMEERKTAGVMVILFLLVFTGLLYASKRKIWADVH
ncbi:MAG: cytochrome c1 [Alphaproteobacteria bacterium]|nr:cytochrome c1 [Alphaproteobacteria bacterium]